jgi:hypothetical protein
MNGLVWGLPPGDWATWFGSVAVSLSLLVLAYGTVKQARETGRQAYLDESAQARLVGATVSSWASSFETEVQINGTNASALSVEKLACYVITGEANSEWTLVDMVEVLPAGEDFVISARLKGIHVVTMVMAFQDDAGITWRKYDGRRLTEIKEGQHNLHGLETERVRKKFRPPPVSGRNLEGEGQL